MVKQEDRFDYKGYPCVILFMSHGHRCGYVGVPNDRKYDIDNIMCHGGVTYCKEHLHFQEDKNTLWIGFDTGHYQDGRDYECIKKYFGDNEIVMKNLDFIIKVQNGKNTGSIRTLEYCKEECKNIVEQIIGVKNNG